MAHNILANWNGRQMPLADVKVSVLDRGFMFGDAVYEVVRIYNGRFFHASDHLDRLAKSLASLQIKGVHLDAVEQSLNSTLAHSNVVEGLAYLQITRGEAPRTHRYPTEYRPNVLIYIDHFDDPYLTTRSTGISAVSHRDIRWARNDIKATSLIANCMAAQYAYEHGCPEVVFINAEGYLTEGSHTSIFGVKDGKLLVAPASANVLPGITKKLVLDLAACGEIPIAEAKVKQADIPGLDEMFIAGTPEEIISVINVDGLPVGNGTCGPVVQRLQKEFKSLVSEYTGQSKSGVQE